MMRTRVQVLAKIAHLEQVLLEDHARGTRVKLKAIPEEGIGPEEGELVYLSFDPTPIEEIEVDPLDDNQMVLVLVDRKYRDGPSDDGLRECSVDQVEWPWNRT